MKGKIVSIAPRSYEYQGSQRATYDLVLDIGEEKRTYSFNKGNTLTVGQEIEFEEVKQGNYYRIQNIKGMAQEQKKSWGGGKTPEEKNEIIAMNALTNSNKTLEKKEPTEEEVTRLADYYFDWIKSKGIAK
jgi:hypothetical protein